MHCLVLLPRTDNYTMPPDGVEKTRGDRRAIAKSYQRQEEANPWVQWPKKPKQKGKKGGGKVKDKGGKWRRRDWYAQAT